YSPGDDSAVRTRAFALRKKLHEFYEHEQPNATLRIDLLKGSFCPHFVESQPRQEAHSHVTPAEPLASPLVPSPTAHEQLFATRAKFRLDWKRSFLPPSSAGVILAALVAGGLYWRLGLRPVSNAGSHTPAPILAEAWGPLLAPNADVMLCIANPASFSVRRGSSSAATTSPTPFNDPSERPMPPQLYELYATRYPAAANLKLAITTNATYWGDVLGALTALKTLNAAGVSPQIFPEMVTAMPTLRRRNVI